MVYGSDREARRRQATTAGDRDGHHVVHGPLEPLAGLPLTRIGPTVGSGPINSSLGASGTARAAVPHRPSHLPRAWPRALACRSAGAAGHGTAGHIIYAGRSRCSNQRETTLIC